jgi:hemolysin III
VSGLSTALPRLFSTIAERQPTLSIARRSGTPRRNATAFSAFRKHERIADIRVLSFGLIVGVTGAAVLVAASFDAPFSLRRIVGVGLYVAGLVAMLGFSLLYRSAVEPGRRRFLRRLDHAAIFAMIAGSTTPFALLRGGAGGTVCMLALWLVAAAGILMKLRFPIGNVRRSAALYLVLGWAALSAMGPAFCGSTALLIVSGGAFYTAGVPFLLWWRLPYRLAIWHTFVLAGAACHYAAILGAVVLA